jgi:hypothetical protein
MTFSPKSNVYPLVSIYISIFVSISLDSTEIRVFIDSQSLAGKPWTTHTVWQFLGVSDPVK